MGKIIMTEAETEDDGGLFIMKSALAAHDGNFKLWPKTSVEYARNMFMRHWKRIPSIEEVSQQIGNEQAHKLLGEIIEWRKFDNALKGYGDPCHYCGAKEDLIHWDFALMRVQGNKRNWGETLASTAISAVTLPLLGAAAIRLPGKSFQGQALHMKVVVCKPCCKKEGNWLGIFMMNEQRASRHPLWKSLQEAGFTKFLDQEKMPDAFRFDGGEHL